MFFVCAQFSVSCEGGLRGQDSGRTRHPHQEPSHQVRGPRLLSHPEEHSAEDAEQGHLTAPGGQDPHRQPKTLADLQIKQKVSQGGRFVAATILSPDYHRTTL